jgi:hypothetical protein
MFLFCLERYKSIPYSKYISPFEDGHELQIPVVVLRNLVCVDECLHFLEDPEWISRFPYFNFPFEQCCNVFPY